MGRKVHPIGFRLGINKEWQSRWYADRNYTELVQEDARIRQMVQQRLSGASLARIEIFVSGTHRQAVRLTHRGAGDHCEGHAQVSRHLADDQHLLVVLLAKVRPVWSDNVEQLRHDGGDTVKMARA